jgi:hypothetical protein
VRMTKLVTSTSSTSSQSRGRWHRRAHGRQARVAIRRGIVAPLRPVRTQVPLRPRANRPLAAITATAVHSGLTGAFGASRPVDGLSLGMVAVAPLPSHRRSARRGLYPASRTRPLSRAWLVAPRLRRHCADVLVTNGRRAWSALLVGFVGGFAALSATTSSGSRSISTGAGLYLAGFEIDLRPRLRAFLAGLAMVPLCGRHRACLFVGFRGAGRTARRQSPASGPTVFLLGQFSLSCPLTAPSAPARGLALGISGVSLCHRVPQRTWRCRPYVQSRPRWTTRGLIAASVISHHRPVPARRCRIRFTGAAGAGRFQFRAVRPDPAGETPQRSPKATVPGSLGKKVRMSSFSRRTPPDIDLCLETRSGYGIVTLDFVSKEMNSLVTGTITENAKGRPSTACCPGRTAGRPIRQDPPGAVRRIRLRPIAPSVPLAPSLFDPRAARLQLGKRSTVRHQWACGAQASSLRTRRYGLSARMVDLGAEPQPLALTNNADFPWAPDESVQQVATAWVQARSRPAAVWSTTTCRRVTAMFAPRTYVRR